MIVGGFPSWSKTETIEKALDDHVLIKLPHELAAKIDRASLKIPGPRGHIAFFDIHVFDFPKRTSLMQIIKEIRAIIGEIPFPDGGTNKLWVSASKPPEHRRQD